MLKAKIGLVVAMKEEADICAKALNLTLQKDDNKYFTYLSGAHDIVMVSPGLDKRYTSNSRLVSRVGKAHAAAVAALLVGQYSPRIIINAGTAGGVSMQGAEIGDVVLASFVTNHDINIPLPGYRKYSLRVIKLDSHESSFPFKTGGVSTGESFSITRADRAKIIKNKALVKDMEAAAVVEAINLISSNTKIIVLKSVTDIVDKEVSSADDFVENFNLATTNLSRALKKIVKDTKK
ncbi:hypothetical protein C4564_00015 [Candidatus Microgenomates bacterium]|nr:MAG: hypothetical protein C4564_00015 [Candidatus Microgenomates bacterium]